jgi:hypothetical protein
MLTSPHNQSVAADGREIRVLHPRLFAATERNRWAA